MGLGVLVAMYRAVPYSAVSGGEVGVDVDMRVIPAAKIVVVEGWDD